ncbi:transposon Ty3-G Gag-Pol polyprotein [Trichonephila clavata]|uniref:Transposon Ty3-G Gag-Pol polyprotein n=1 Tax=Trichonephila clavata TaxID=2740835 RepID=A0A8X6K9N6_TRICU|nr:transposon Ty3-G Gag-Pol polyprotein [Trichonephila clavata]
MILNDIKSISIALKNFKTEKIKLLYKFIYDEDGDHSNRKRLRNLCGFDFTIDSDEFRNKLRDGKKMLSFNEIITISNVLNISIEGNKAELCKNLLSFLTDISQLEVMASDANELESESQSSQNKNNIHSSMQADTIGKKSDSESVINYVCSIMKVVLFESTLTQFKAESHEHIIHWIEQFENISKLFNLSEIQEFIFAKRSLCGHAALFVRTEPNINSWQRLKQALINEFGMEINSANLHELLSKRKMMESESP